MHEAGVRQSKVGHVSGESVEIAQSAVGTVSGSVVSIRQSLVRQLTAERATVSQSSMASARAQRLELRESAAFLAIGRDVAMEGGRVLLLLSPRVSGQVAATFTLPAAFAMGLGFVLGRALLRMLGSLRL